MRHEKSPEPLHRPVFVFLDLGPSLLSGQSFSVSQYLPCCGRSWCTAACCAAPRQMSCRGQCWPIKPLPVWGTDQVRMRTTRTEMLAARMISVLVSSWRSHCHAIQTVERSAAGRYLVGVVPDHRLARVRLAQKTPQQQVAILHRIFFKTFST